MSKSKAKEAPKFIPIPQEAKQHIATLNMYLAGVRAGAGVPADWIVNRETTAFIPTPKGD